MRKQSTKRASKTDFISIMVMIISALVLVGLYIFNHQPQTYDRYILVNIGGLLWIPMVAILLIQRGKLSDYGLTIGESSHGYKLAGICFMLILPALIIAARYPTFSNFYPLQKMAERSLPYFIYFELSYGMYLFCWEFFFRGFMLLGLTKKLGILSLFIQATAFMVMHIGKPDLEVAASFPAALILGIIAIRSKSFLPCFLLHWAVAFTFDVLIILGKLGVII